MAIPTTYTGQNSGAAPVFSGGKTSSAISQGISQMLGAKQQDVGLARQEAKEFGEAIDLDPIQVASTRVMEAQAEKIDGFISKWSSVIKDREGRMTMQDKAKMNAAKQDLMAWQGTAQSEYQNYLQQTEKFDERYHDRNEFIQRSAEYIRDGKMPHGGLLTPRSLSYNEFSSLFSANGKEWQKRFGSEVSRNGNVVTTQQTTDASDDDVKGEINRIIFGDPTGIAYKSLVNLFKDQSAIVKQKYFDMADQEGDGLDDTERKNAYLEWAYDTQKHKFLPGKPKERYYVSAGGSDTDIDVSAGGYLDKTTGYGWKPESGGFAFVYGKMLSENEKGFDIPAPVIEDYLPDDVATDNGVIFTKPTWVSKDGKTVRINVPTYKVEDMVTKKTKLIGKTRYEELKQQFEKSGKDVLTEVLDGKTVRYRMDEDGNIYRLSNQEVEKREITVPFNAVKMYVNPYFKGLSSNIQTQETATQNKEHSVKNQSVPSLFQ